MSRGRVPGSLDLGSDHVSMLRALIVCFAIGLFFSSELLASSFKVSPLRLHLEGETKSTSMRVINSSPAEITVQIDMKRWTQNAGGEDVFENSDALLFFPRIVTILANGEGVVRVAWRGGDRGQKEQTFRLFAQEVPDASPAAGALSFALRLSVPVFVRSASAAERAVVSSLAVADAEARVIVANAGQRHTVVERIRLQTLDAAEVQLHEQEISGWYVLSGAQRLFSARLPQEACARSRLLRVEVTTTAGTQRRELPLSGCLGRQAYGSLD